MGCERFLIQQALRLNGKKQRAAIESLPFLRSMTGLAGVEAPPKK